MEELTIKTLVEIKKHIDEQQRLKKTYGILSVNYGVQMDEQSFFFNFPNSYETIKHDRDEYSYEHEITVGSMRFFCISEEGREVDQ